MFNPISLFLLEMEVFPNPLSPHSFNKTITTTTTQLVPAYVQVSLQTLFYNTGYVELGTHFILEAF